MADQWYKFGNGFMFVYSITDRPTYESLPSFHQDILRVKDRSYIPCVVVSNKVRQYHVQSPARMLMTDLLSVIWADCGLWDNWKGGTWPSAFPRLSSSAQP
jgi:hypothetical protein